MEHQKKLLLIPYVSGVTIAMSLSGSIQDFLKLSFHMFPWNKIFKVASDLIFEISKLRYFEIPNFSQIRERVWEL